MSVGAHEHAQSAQKVDTILYYLMPVILIVL